MFHAACRRGRQGSSRDRGGRESGQSGGECRHRRGGELGVPTVGGFKDGRSEFYDHETWDGRPIVVRFVITPRGPDAIHFEQAFSTDDGKTWELNWIADDTRTP